MATRRYGLSVGENYTQVTEAVGSATAADDIELTVNLATVTKREQILMALERIQMWVIKGNWPPV